jgi:hypothetical protein
MNYNNFSTWDNPPNDRYKIPILHNLNDIISHLGTGVTGYTGARGPTGSSGGPTGSTGPTGVAGQSSYGQWNWAEAEESTAPSSTYFNEDAVGTTPGSNIILYFNPTNLTSNGLLFINLISQLSDSVGAYLSWSSRDDTIRRVMNVSSVMNDGSGNYYVEGKIVSYVGTFNDSKNPATFIISAFGSTGATGRTGPTGVAGPTGIRGTQLASGNRVPTEEDAVSAYQGDLYLNTSNSVLYKLDSAPQFYSVQSQIQSGNFVTYQNDIWLALGNTPVTIQISEDRQNWNAVTNPLDTDATYALYSSGKWVVTGNDATNNNIKYSLNNGEAFFEFGLEAVLNVEVDYDVRSARDYIRLEQSETVRKTVVVK